MNKRTKNKHLLRMVLRQHFFVRVLGLSITLGLLIYFQISNPKQVYSAVAGEFRTKVSGNWNSTASWETFNGTSWVAAVATPTSTDNIITILNGHIITITANITADQVVINNGGQITVNSGIVFTIADGAGTDIQVSGILKNSGTITLSGSSTASILSGGTYDHNQNTGNILIATWNTGSTCAITGVTVTLPANITQSFYNLTYNCPNQTSVENTQANLTTVNGNFNVISTGTGALRFGPSNLFTFSVGGDFNLTGGSLFLCGSNSPVFNITGNFNVSGGSCVFTDASNSSGNGTPTMNVSGDINISGGTIEMSQFASNTAGKGIGTMNLYGNYNQTGGMITETANTLAASGFGRINFAKLGTQIFYRNTGTITNTIHFTVNGGSILDMGVSFPTGNGTFTLSSGGALIMASPDGITQTSIIGNVQVTGTRTYSTSANYTYDAVSAQVTGDGLPAIVNNLTCDNNSNVTLTNTVSVNGVLIFTNGKIITNAKELFVTNSSSSGILGQNSNNYVVGNLRRNINTSGSYDFPLGTLTNYELINVTLSSSVGTSNILGTFSNSNPIENSYPLSGIYVNGTAIDDVLNFGYWTLTPNSALTSGTYSVTLNESGHTNPADNASSYCVLKRSGLENNWQSIGTHNSATQSQSNGIATALRSGLSSFSHFSIGKYSGNGGGLPIELIYFNAKYITNRVELSWATASELNNDYFTIERSTDGIIFEPVLSKKGAGNSTITLKYTDVDANPLEGVSYYRLKQTDYDNHFTYSEVKSIKFSPSQNNDGTKNLNLISISPNPFNEYFICSFKTNTITKVEFQLLNSSGQIVAKDNIVSTDGINQYQFNNDKNLKPGIYLAVLLCNDERIVTKLLKK